MVEISDGKDAVTGVVTASFGFDPGMVSVARSPVNVGRLEYLREISKSVADSGGGKGGRKLIDGWVEAWCSAVNRSRVGEAASSLQRSIKRHTPTGTPPA